MDDLYVSFDVESDGPCPLDNSMINFGAVFYNSNGVYLNEYSVNLYPLSNATADPGTSAWWRSQFAINPELEFELMKDRKYAFQAIPDFVRFSESVQEKHKGKLVAMAYPAGYDWSFLYTYMLKFAGKSPYGFSCLDIKTYAMAKLGIPFHEAHKKNFPKHWFNKNLKHTHLGIDDAKEQAALFFSARNGG